MRSGTRARISLQNNAFVFFRWCVDQILPEFLPIFLHISSLEVGLLRAVNHLFGKAYDIFGLRVATKELLDLRISFRGGAPRGSFDGLLNRRDVSRDCSWKDFIICDRILHSDVVLGQSHSAKIGVFPWRRSRS